MPIPLNKEALISAIESNYHKLKQELTDIPSDKATEKELDGHAKETKMSLIDLLAYLTGWAELVLKWQERSDQGLQVDFPETGYKWNELGKLAQKFYIDYQDEDFEGIQVKLDHAVQRILILVKRKTNAELYEKRWYREWSMGRMIQFNTASPYANARVRIRKYKKAGLN